MIAILSALTCLALAPPPAVQDPSPALERRWTDEQLEDLAQGLTRYFEARTTRRGLDEARADLAARVQALREATDGAEPLAHPADLGRAAWLARGYADVRVRPGKVLEEETRDGSFRDEGMTLAYRLPKEYAPGTTSYPLILALPDVDEEPAAHLRANWKLREVLDGAILVSPEMPSERDHWTQVMVEGRPGGLSYALTALRIATERFAVDFDRVYVAGRGKGVPAALAAGNYAPQRFAGVVARAGDADEIGPENFGNLPTLFTGAGANARAFQEAVDDLGFENCTLEPAGTEADVWDWMAAHPRPGAPERAGVVVGISYPSRVSWLRVASIAADSRATARVDRASNTIVVDGRGVSHATLYLNDALVDLGRPVKVICNGVDHEVEIERSLSTMLDLLHDGTSDPGCVYVAEEQFDMSGAEPQADAGAAVVDPDFERLLTSADDVAALWKLHGRCLDAGRTAQALLVLKKLVRITPADGAEHARAREALGHVQAEGQWFSTKTAFERFRRSQDPALAEAKGHVKHDSLWMHPEERSLASKGWTKLQERGVWHSPADRRRLEEGWVQQDLTWIAPEEAHHVDAGRWRVAGEWFDLETANRRHARLDSMWVLPSADVLLYTTTDRDVGLRAMDAMSRAFPDLNRIFGVEPLLPLPVVLLRHEEQYDRFAFGDPDGRRGPAHAGRLHIVHSAFFAESWFPSVEGEREHRGVGVGFWNSLDPNGHLYGVHSVRLAVGLSYADAIDPSPKAVRRAQSKGVGPEFYEDYFAEKQLPAWLRTGGAVYAERYFRDETVGADGDPWWARNWSLDNLKRLGGLRGLEEVFAFDLDPDDREDGLKLMLEAGLLVAFVVDGDCAPVREAHEKLKRGLVSGRVHARQVEALTEALTEAEDELRAFAGL